MMPELFTVEETNLLCAFLAPPDESGRVTGDRNSLNTLAGRLAGALPRLGDPHIAEITQSVLNKLSQMSGEDFAELF
jgi:hypothetical protein